MPAKKPAKKNLLTADANLRKAAKGYIVAVEDFFAADIATLRNDDEQEGYARARLRMADMMRVIMDVAGKI